MSTNHREWIDLFADERARVCCTLATLEGGSCRLLYIAAALGQLSGGHHHDQVLAIAQPVSHSTRGSASSLLASLLLSISGFLPRLILKIKSMLVFTLYSSLNYILYRRSLASFWVWKFARWQSRRMPTLQPPRRQDVQKSRRGERFCPRRRKRYSLRVIYGSTMPPRHKSQRQPQFAPLNKSLHLLFPLQTFSTSIQKHINYTVSDNELYPPSQDSNDVVQFALEDTSVRKSIVYVWCSWEGRNSYVKIAQ